MKPPMKPETRPDVSSWKEATALTVTRIQRIFELIEDEPMAVRAELYRLAHNVVVAQGRASDATQYWNTFVNALRTLVAGMTECEREAIPF